MLYYDESWSLISCFAWFVSLVGIGRDDFECSTKEVTPTHDNAFDISLRK